MTEAPVKPARSRRLSKRALRVWAWIIGTAAFASPWVALGLSPKPSTASASPASKRPVVIIRKITRRVIVRSSPKPAPVHYVYAGGSSSGGSVSLAASPTTTTGGSGT